MSKLLCFIQSPCLIQKRRGANSDDTECPRLLGSYTLECAYFRVRSFRKKSLCARSITALKRFVRCRCQTFAITMQGRPIHGFFTSALIICNALNPTTDAIAGRLEQPSLACSNFCFNRPLITDCPPSSVPDTSSLILASRSCST